MGVAVVVLPLLIVADEFVLDFAGWLPSLPTFISNGLIPLALVLLALIGFYDGMKKWFAATHCETVQSLFILLLVGLIILTITGVWFRGPGMALMWPWDVAAAVGHTL